LPSSFDSFATYHVGKRKNEFLPEEGKEIWWRLQGASCSQWPSLFYTCAIHYFAGGSPYDIGCVYGVSHRSVMESVWVIVEAINMTPQFNIFYPESLEAQRRIAPRFEKYSAIDGILIWTTKPSLADAKIRGIDQKKYLCCRKHTFGLNCQAASDARGCFLDVSNIYGGSTSDCLTFEGSDLYKRCTQILMKQDVDESNNSQEILPSLEVDNNVLKNRDDGYVEMVGVNKHETALPTDLINGGHHYDDYALYQARVMSEVSSAMASVTAFVAFQCDESNGGRKPGASTIKRERKNIEQYIGRMNERSFRRRYRMYKDAFWMLLELIAPHLPNTGEERQRGAVPNGPITHASRLSMALRYFAGGDPLDISDVHGVGDDEPLRSVWLVIDAIHMCSELNIVFPETHAEQTECASGFRATSSINIDCCIGAIDGMLVWMNKPTSSDQHNIGFGPTKFFCGRKMKYGLNMMGVCDSSKRFIWIELNMPGAASDFYAFDQSSLKKKLETEGFLRPGYCLFGDNAYINTPYISGAYVWDSVTESGGGADRLDDLLDGGEHMDDHTRDQRRVYRAERDLPCYRILDYFYEQSLERPELSAQRLANNPDPVVLLLVRLEVGAGVTSLEAELLELSIPTKI
ncbi:hypothetical protein HJC23_000795, partial [Cyclotella cryptica]